MGVIKMHIPDGFLDVKTAVVTYASAGTALGFSLKKLRTSFNEEKIPLLGLLGAFIFITQMINLPIIGGTSGHLLGGVLAMLVVGPWAASIVLTSILLIQSIFFMDGGLMALGANVFNMAIIGVFVGYWIYNGLKKFIASYKVRVFISAYLSTVIASAAASIELAVSGKGSLNVIFTAMVGWHSLIGIIEGVITLLVIVYLVKVMPERLEFLRDERVKLNEQ